MNQVRKLLSQAGCILEGDYFFALKKRGLISKKYINIDPVFTNPASVRSLGHALVRPFQLAREERLTCIVGPAVGGIPLVYAAAFAAIEGLDMGEEAHQINTAFAEKDGDGFVFGRMGFHKAVRGQNVLVVEDISSTGETTKAVCELVKQAGGNLIGASLIWNRGGVTAEKIGVPELNALVTEGVETFEVSALPEGWGELPLVSDVGHPDYYPEYRGPKIQLLAA